MFFLALVTHYSLHGCFLPLGRVEMEWHEKKKEEGTKWRARDFFRKLSLSLCPLPPRSLKHAANRKCCTVGMEGGSPSPDRATDRGLILRSLHPSSQLFAPLRD